MSVEERSALLDKLEQEVAEVRQLLNEIVKQYEAKLARLKKKAWGASGRRQEACSWPCGAPCASAG